MKTAILKAFGWIAPLLLAAVSESAQAEDFELRSGIDVLLRKQSAVEALHFVTLSRDLGGGLHAGQSLYSAAKGDAGGLFIGGFELFQRVGIGPGWSLDIGGFVGGGGGARAYYGDGLMTKGQVTLNHAFAHGFTAHLGAGWTRVGGSAIDTPHFNFAVSRNARLGVSPGHDAAAPATGVTLASAKALGRLYHPVASARRNSPGNLSAMHLVGGEVTFRGAASGTVEVFLAAAAAAGGDGGGYADWFIGPRFFTSPVFDGRLRAFADLGLGFGGGGDVNTGGGLMVSVSAGLDLKLAPAFHAEAGLMAVGAFGGDFRASAAFLRAALRFDDPQAQARDGKPGLARHWRFSTGLSYQASHPGFRKRGHRFIGSSVALIETGVDLLLTPQFYLNGTVYGAFDGLAGGFGMGTVGIGLEYPLGPGSSISGEVFGGAAAGAGIATGGGFIGGGKIELDYKVRDNLALSVGAGRWFSRGSARPWTLHAGVKIPFTTGHAN
jgi:hypothetical protein